MYSHNCHIWIIWSAIDMNETVCFEFMLKICVEKLGGKIRLKIGWKNWVGKLGGKLGGQIRLTKLGGKLGGKIGWKNWVEN